MWNFDMMSNFIMSRLIETKPTFIIALRFKYTNKVKLLLGKVSLDLSMYNFYLMHSTVAFNNMVTFIDSTKTIVLIKTFLKIFLWIDMYNYDFLSKKLKTTFWRIFRILSANGYRQLYCRLPWHFCLMNEFMVFDPWHTFVASAIISQKWHMLLFLMMQSVIFSQLYIKDILIYRYVFHWRALKWVIWLIAKTNRILHFKCSLLKHVHVYQQTLQWWKEVRFLSLPLISCKTISYHNRKIDIINWLVDVFGRHFPQAHLPRPKSEGTAVHCEHNALWEAVGKPVDLSLF